MPEHIIQRHLVCVALNDADYFNRQQSCFQQAPYQQPPTEPVLYFKPRNTFSSDGATVANDSGQSLVVGASLGLVIGQPCCRIRASEALAYVAGITLVHDFSLPETSYYRPDIKGKCLDGSAPVGSKVVSVADFSDLVVTTLINGEEKARLPVTALQRSPAQLLASISRIMTLQPGDVVATGFIGERLPVRAGDQVQSGINDLLILSNKVGG